jgi:Family of unknown function (DUF6790)
MYILMIVLTMFVFPIGSILVELFFFKSTVGIVPLIGKWYVFWAVGVRLFIAGLRQSTNPKFTAQQILGINSDEPLQIVQELGFANLSIGLLGILTILNGNWIIPAAIAGGLFYGLAGTRHVFKEEKNFLENAAMLSNAIIFVLLIGFLIRVMVH